jgi:hypothetical protein
MFDKIFGWGKKKPGPNPDIRFGRYSDNNKPLEKVNLWTDADNFYKEKKFFESIDAFFEYLCDDSVRNVWHKRNGQEGHFYLYQGSKMVRGIYDPEHLQAEVTLARMASPSVPVMRRLLEMNFTLYYSRYALAGERICMRFDTELVTANPGKLYYAFKELATKADKQDDLLVQDFTSLETVDTEHITEIPESEKEIKYRYLQKWVTEVLEIIKTVDAEKFSGGIAYLLLALSYRLDYLLTPEGNLLNEIEKIVEIYFRKDDRPVIEKNRDMTEAFEKLAAKTKEEIFPYLFRSKYTFSIVLPQVYKTIADAIFSANQNIAWYRDNNYPFIARQICEYGIAYCQYSYSLPRPVTELFHLFMMVNYSEFFDALGFKEQFYDVVDQRFDEAAITGSIRDIQEKWKAKYPNLNFKIENLGFSNMVSFNYSFTTELETLNMESK